MAAAVGQYSRRCGRPFRTVLAVVGANFLVFAVWRYFRSDNPNLKLRCTVYQTSGANTLSFPDKMVCLTWYQLRR
jgi:hypothetical protein